MLRELHIENVAVIERADLELGPGLNILTGETGAGKSILVDAMHAILGARASRELVRTGAEKAVVCADVRPWPVPGHGARKTEIECDDELIIRRQITAEGKTSCRVCGVPVTTAQLRSAGCAAARHPRPERRAAPARRAGAPAQVWTGSANLEPELARYQRAVPGLSGAVQGA
ncbi:MAG: AAA family ATPase [Oscillospiraceae bacterium]